MRMAMFIYAIQAADELMVNIEQAPRERLIRTALVREPYLALHAHRRSDLLWYPDICRYGVNGVVVADCRQIALLVWLCGVNDRYC